MTILEICKQYALKYSKEIIKKACPELPGLPEYFDWADHIADEQADYPYHLNKVTEDINTVIKFYSDIIKDNKDKEKINKWEEWRKNWYDILIAAGWLHDIGMLKDRNNHNYESANYLFSNTDGFEFTGLKKEERLKIAILCIKHNKSWEHTYQDLQRLLITNSAKNDNINIVDIDKEWADSKVNWSDEYYAILESFFPGKIPDLQLALAGNIISFCDSLRYRGFNIQNNLKMEFSIWSQCTDCNTIYLYNKRFCSTANCLPQSIRKDRFTEDILNKIALKCDRDLIQASYSQSDKNYLQLGSINEDDKNKIAYIFKTIGYYKKPDEKPMIHHAVNMGAFNHAGMELTTAVEFYAVDGKRIHNMKPSSAGNDVKIAVRPQSRLYTLGDMAINNVILKSYAEWEKELKNNKIDMSEFLQNEIENNLRNQTLNQKIILQLTINSNLAAPALFTLDNYITSYLAENSSVSIINALFNFSYKLILYIKIDNDMAFIELFKDILFSYSARDMLNEIRANDIEIPENNTGSSSSATDDIERIRKSLGNIYTTFNEWKINKMIIPVEIFNNKIRIIDFKSSEDY